MKSYFSIVDFDDLVEAGVEACGGTGSRRSRQDRPTTQQHKSRSTIKVKLNLILRDVQRAALGLS